MISVLVSCFVFCKLQYYEVGFSHKDPKYCWCAEKVKKDTPTPLEINLQWKPSIPEENRKADLPVITSFPRYEIDGE
jgi:hypothetical protein